MLIRDPSIAAELSRVMNRIMPTAPQAQVIVMPRLLSLPSIDESDASLDGETPAAPQATVLFREATSDVECCVCLSSESEIAPGHSVKLVGKCAREARFCRLARGPHAAMQVASRCTRPRPRPRLRLRS